LKLRSLGPRHATHHTPIVVLLDESVHVRQASRYRIDDSFAELLATMRHEGIGLVWTAQQPQLAHYSLLTMGTEIVIFRLHAERTRKPLFEAGVPESWDRVIATLPNHKHLRFSLDGSGPITGDTTATQHRHPHNGRA
jgi:hypothetical protein